MHALLTLVVYTYTSFAASWGPGPVLVKEFEKQCACTVKLVDAGDAGALISRLKMEGANSSADVVVGVDEAQLPKISNDLHMDVRAVMFDYGPYAFVYNSSLEKNPPQSLDDLLDPRFEKSIAIEDPRLSTTGLGFLMWVRKVKGDKTWDYFRRLKKQVLVTSPSWDLAYGLFKKNKVRLVMSYWTSPAYHIQEENRTDIKAATFKDGHYVQREFAFVMPSEGPAAKKALAQKFLNFLLSKEAQAAMPKYNFMYPANKSAELTSAFKKLGPLPSELDRINPLPAADQLEDWLNQWRSIF